MDPQQQFCLKWNSFGSNLVSAFDNLFKSESLTDVTLFCEGVTLKAHKIILAACSKHFQDLFEAAPHCPNVLVILDGTSSENMAALLEFMYKGEVHVKHESLTSFLKAAECLQVKGLSIEHEKMAEAQGEIHFVPRIDSPSRNNKQGKASEPSGGGKEGGEEASMHPPCSSSFTPVLSSHNYMHHYMMSQFDRSPSSPYDAPPRKRPHRSPSDSSIRASVLRDGSKPERESPLSLTYSSHPPSPAGSARYELGGDGGVNNVTPSGTSLTAVPFDRSAAVESDAPGPDTWNSSSSCAEDLRVKLESPAADRVKSEWGGYSGGGRDGGEGNTSGGGEPHTPERERLPAAGRWPIVPVNSVPTSKVVTSLKRSTATTTPDGKKLQCPFCERLYGYETNLRAHIRQRHQGIRVPCPFCSRTFTRNNTVRRHIAREHKTELSPFQQTDLTPFQQAAQVQNHNQ